MITLRCRGSYEKTEKFLKKGKDINEVRNILEKYGREGISALSSATPVDSGGTATSWSFDVIQDKNSISLVFSNSSATKTGTSIIILLQYGHGNGDGGYVRGTDIVNPAIQPIFDRIAEEAWREVNE